MVESSGWTCLTFPLSPQLQIQIQELHLPSSLAGQFSFAQLQILAPSIFFHPDDRKVNTGILGSVMLLQTINCKMSVQPQDPDGTKQYGLCKACV